MCFFDKFWLTLVNIDTDNDTKFDIKMVRERFTKYKNICSHGHCIRTLDSRDMLEGVSKLSGLG